MCIYLKSQNNYGNGGSVPSWEIQKYVERQMHIERLLPESGSFFIIAEPSLKKYHFLGKQQESISGYSNTNFLKKGTSFFLKCLHPNEIDIILDQIYNDFATVIAQTSGENKKRLRLLYNYRFKRNDGEYLNLLEQINILEFDHKGRGMLFLGNIIKLENNDMIPLRASATLIREKGLSKTLFSRLYPTSANRNHISRREKSILKELGTGKTSREIASKLFISPHTVDTHRRNLLKKLKCRSVVELVRFAMVNGLLAIGFIVLLDWQSFFLEFSL